MGASASSESISDSRSFESSQALDIPEVLELIIDRVDEPSDLLNCACVNAMWHRLALKKLYRGSMNDMRYSTPSLMYLNGLFTASRERFTQYMSYVEHLVVLPEMLGEDIDADPINRFVSFEICRALRNRDDATLLLQPKGKGPKSVAIPYKMRAQNLSPIFDLILHPHLTSLTIDHYYWQHLVDLLEHEPSALTAPMSSLAALSVHRSHNHMDVENLCTILRSCDLSMFNIQQEYQVDALTKADIAQLLRSLWQHRHLKALSLSVDVLAMPNSELVEGPDEATIIWPKLKVLYLNTIHQSWSKKLPEFEIKTFGWPILRIDYYGNLEDYSSRKDEDIEAAK